MAAPAVSLVAHSSTQAAFVSRVVACESRATSSQQQFPSPRASSFTRATVLPARRHTCVSRSLRSRQLTTGWPYGCRVVAAASAGTAIVASASVGDVNEAIKDAAKEALHLAAFYEHPEVVQVLLAAGADTDARNSTGNTPLQGNLDVVRMPFETTKVKCQKLCPSLSQFACIKGNLDVARILLDAGADLYATSDDKGNALEYAQGVHARWL
ncbi:unnamed protein product [Closterium sp. NIES-64]|nr:unnamed protein product [Closterium sp. NIES-64]